MTKPSSDSLLGRELTRKEFLGSIAGVLLVLIGVTNFMKAISQLHSGNKKLGPAPIESSHGFGASKFGR